MKVHWTGRSIKDYIFRIAADFIVQLEKKMESLPLSQDEFAKKLKVTKGRVSQIINHPGNISLAKMVEYASALGMKVSIVAYEDDDPENKKGPINSEIFKMCWEEQGKPNDFFALQGVDEYKGTGANIKTTGWVNCIIDTAEGVLRYPCLTTKETGAIWVGMYGSVEDRAYASMFPIETATPKPEEIFTEDQLNSMTIN